VRDISLIAEKEMQKKDKPAWIEVSILIHPVALEALSAFLFDMGCEGVVSEDFGDPGVKAYLPFTEDMEEVRARLEAFLGDLAKIFPEAAAPELSLEPVEDRDWSLLWRRFFKTEQVTPRLTVAPAWETPPDPGEGHVIRMDPGPAFGTGRHATTRMCLQAMELACPGGPWSLLDVGTGSGILAIYGALLGATRIKAVDIDPDAIRWAERNIDLNHAGKFIELSTEPVGDLEEAFSMVVANLILGEIVGLFSCLPPLLEPGGTLILSGILTEQEGRVQDLLRAHGLGEGRVLRKGEWSCLVAG
jgi:ribosomal protein L11 methyltransferase